MSAEVTGVSLGPSAAGLNNPFRRSRNPGDSSAFSVSARAAVLTGGSGSSLVLGASVSDVARGASATSTGGDGSGAGSTTRGGSGWGRADPGPYISPMTGMVDFCGAVSGSNGLVSPDGVSAARIGDSRLGASAAVLSAMTAVSAGGAFSGSSAWAGGRSVAGCSATAVAFCGGSGSVVVSGTASGAVSEPVSSTEVAGAFSSGLKKSDRRSKKPGDGVRSTDSCAASAADSADGMDAGVLASGEAAISVSPSIGCGRGKDSISTSGRPSVDGGERALAGGSGVTSGGGPVGVASATSGSTSGLKNSAKRWNRPGWSTWRSGNSATVAGSSDGSSSGNGGGSAVMSGEATDSPISDRLCGTNVAGGSIGACSILSPLSASSGMSTANWVDWGMSLFGDSSMDCGSAGSISASRAVSGISSLGVKNSAKRRKKPGPVCGSSLGSPVPAEVSAPAAVSMSFAGPSSEELSVVPTSTLVSGASVGSGAVVVDVSLSICPADGASSDAVGCAGITASCWDSSGRGAIGGSLAASGGGGAATGS